MRNKKSVLNNQRGVALLVTLFAVMIMTFLAVEIGYNSHVELAVAASATDRLKAYYLAKTGVELSLLRINIYKTVYQRFGSQLGAQKGALDMIWQFPFAWPPALPSGASGMDKDSVTQVVKKSFLDGAFSTSIEAEGGKIDITDLVSPAKTLREAAYAQLVKILQDRLDADDDWARDHRGNIRPEEVVNNITDWMDEDHESLNGGDESSYYSNTNPPIVPTNRPFKTLNELHMVKGVTDEIYNIIAPRVTIYGSKGINVNYASREVLKSLDKQITDDVANAVIARRSDPDKGPFQSADDFAAFLTEASRGAITAQTFNQKPPVPLLFDAEYNFRIKSTGIYSRAQRDIVAVAFDFDKVKGQLTTYLSSPTPSGTATPPNQPPGKPTATPSPTPSPTPTSSKGPPTIVFWQEF